MDFVSDELLTGMSTEKQPLLGTVEDVDGGAPPHSPTRSSTSSLEGSGRHRKLTSNNPNQLSPARGMDAKRRLPSFSDFALQHFSKDEEKRHGSFYGVGTPTSPGNGGIGYTDLETGMTRLEPKHETEDARALREAAAEADDQQEPGCCSVRERKKRRKLLDYYEYQSELLNQYALDWTLLSDGQEGVDAVAANDAEAKRVQRLDVILAQITFVLNVVLLIAKVTAAVVSRSLSIFSTVIDSLVDITSGLVIWLTLRAIKNHNPLEYPRGRNKLEPLAVVIVAIIMGAANLVMIIQSMQSIITNSMNPEVDLLTLIILLTGTAIKVVLLFICLRHKTPSSMVLAMDQRNDIITNLVALGMGLVGTYFWRYADPIGAILVSSYIAFSWFFAGADQVPILTGRAASAEFTARITHIIITHDERIQKVDALWVYHYGTNFLVEAHIVLEPTMSLEESHNLAEPLTNKLETLPYVERAFIHCDYRVDSIYHGTKQ